MVHRLVGSRLAMAVVASAVTAVFLGGVGWAVAQSSAGGGETFYACVSGTGTVRAATIRVGHSPTSCRATETVTSWNAEGVPGQQGPVGQASVVSLPPAGVCPEPPSPNPDPAASPAAFLAIPSIPGDSTDSAHVNQINVLSWSWGANRSNHATCGAARSDQASLLDLTVVKRIDKASPKLMLSVASGTNLSTITLSLAKQGTDYLVITLANAIASSYQPAGGGGGDVPKEQVTFTANKVTMSFRAQRADGTFEAPITTCFDALVQTAC